MITKYGVYGKVEFLITLVIGSKSVPVDFEGGSISARGQIPASYTTNNPVIQSAIEVSPEFKLGIIKKLRSIPEECDVIASKKIEEAKAEQGNNDNPEDVPATDQGNEANITGENIPANDTPKTEVEVTCMEDAVEYLKANFEGYTSSKLRTKAAVERAAAEHDIVFVGL